MEPSLYAYGIELVDSQGRASEETIRINITRSEPLLDPELGPEKVGQVINGKWVGPEGGFDKYYDELYARRHGVHINETDSIEELFNSSL